MIEQNRPGAGQEPEVITPPNRLKSKVGVGGPGAVDERMLEKAEQMVAEMAGDYLEWVKDDLANLQTAIDQALADTDNRQAHLDEAYHIAHDMKGQGGSFDYGLITDVAKQLCIFLEGLDGYGPKELAIGRLHVDAMRMVLTKRMTGDGGPAGRRLVAGLEMCVRKIAPQPAGQTEDK